MNLMDREWKAFKCEDVFNIYTGASIPVKDLINGNIPRITASETNNGVIGYYKKMDIKNYRELTNFISISFLGGVFYHPYTASLDMKIHAVKLVDRELNKYLGVFLVRAIKQTVSRFTYGDQLSSTDLPRQKILLPVNNDGKPDFEFMELYAKEKEYKMLSKYKKYLKNLDTLTHTHGHSLEDIEWKEYKLCDIFNYISRGKRLKKGDHINGNIPYISSTMLNNGVDGFIGNKRGKKFDNCLTIANSGSVGYSFYHPYEFIGSDHVTALKDDRYNRYTYIFTTVLLKRLSEKYSFNREINDYRINEEKILMPVNTKTGKIAYDYMEEYIKYNMKKQIEKYLAYKQIKFSH